MASIRVVDRDGIASTVPAAEGASLMIALKGAGLPVQAICGGAAICGTCHVYIEDAWLDELPPPGLDEESVLSMSLHRRENSRLACQIPVSTALDGLVLTLATED